MPTTKQEVLKSKTPDQIKHLNTLLVTGTVRLTCASTSVAATTAVTAKGQVEYP